jgi:hypothetical protein
VSAEKDKHNADAMFVDETGGYGAGVVDDLRRRGYAPIGIKFGGKPSDPRYFDKRSEMLFTMAEWVKSSGALAPDPELKAELLALRFVYQGDKFRVVPKDIIKKELGRSPDKSDALALTFAYPVQRGGQHAATPAQTQADYDPYGD